MNREVHFKNEFGKTVINGLISIPKTFPLTIEGENLIYEGSPLIGSTAFGYILEAYVAKILVDANKKFVQKNLTGNSTKESYDITFTDNGFSELINIKVEKDSSANNAVAAWEPFLYDISLQPLSTRFYVAKFLYKINEKAGNVTITGFELYNVDKAFLEDTNVKSDSRNWSDDYKNDAAGRFQVKNTEAISKEISHIEINQKYIELATGFLNDFKKQIVSPTIKESGKKKVQNKIIKFEEIIRNLKSRK